MARKTEYSCDKCGHVQPLAEQMWNVRVQYQHEGSYGDSRFWSSKEQMWCRKCLENAGLVAISPATKRDEPAPEVKPTLEELIRDIARDEINSLTGAC